MTYKSLEGSIDILRIGNEDILSSEIYSDEQLQLICKDGAKLEMKIDIEQALGINSNGYETELNKVTSENLVRFSRALAFKQLSLFYKENNIGSEVKSRIRWELYSSLYERERLSFSTLSK